MTDPFIGEVQIFGFPFAPSNWAFAAGQLMPLSQATALYSLYGTTFGGNGSTNFALPNLAGRQGCSAGNGIGTDPHALGDVFGAYAVALAAPELPMHNHVFLDYQPDDSTGLIDVPTPASAIGYAVNDVFNAFGPATTTKAMHPNAVGMSGSGSPHENRQPFLGLTYAVALVGNFPSLAGVEIQVNAVN